MKIAVIGADGQLGTDLLSTLRRRHEVHPLYYPAFDVTRPESVSRELSAVSADVVINTAAYNLVDQAEVEPEAAFALNAFSVRSLARICRELGAALMHFSSDYVFGGGKTTPYSEDDHPHPLSVYGISKYAGELMVEGLLDKHYLVRTCGLYGTAGCWGKGTNFVDAVVARAERKEPLRIVSDQTITPTATHELAEKVGELLEKGGYGLYHLTNEGACTWYEFAGAIFEMLGLNPEVIPIDSEELGAGARRPSYSVLENRRAGEAGLTRFSSWRTALREYLTLKGRLKSAEKDR